MALAIFCARHIRRVHRLTAGLVSARLLETPEILIAAEQGEGAVQKLLLEAQYPRVSVYASTYRPLPNPEWKLVIRKPHEIDAGLVGDCDEGFLIWDGRSPQIILNVLRLMSSARKVTFLCDGGDQVETLSALADWSRQTGRCPDDTEMPREALSGNIDPLLNPLSSRGRSRIQKARQVEESGNRYLESGETGAFAELIFSLAKARGTAHVASVTGLARSSLYRSLNVEGRPEFGTVVKVLAALGYKLQLARHETVDRRHGDHLDHG